MSPLPIAPTTYQTPVKLWRPFQHGNRLCHIRQPFRPLRGRFPRDFREARGASRTGRQCAVRHWRAELVRHERSIGVANPHVKQAVFRLDRSRYKSRDRAESERLTPLQNDWRFAPASRGRSTSPFPENANSPANRGRCKRLPVGRLADKPMSALGLEPRTYGLKVRGSRANAKAKTADSESTGPTTGPSNPTGPDDGTPLDSDLAKFFAAWPMLAEPLKRAVLALIESASR